MWVPRTEAEIVAAVQGGTLRETSRFDAKAELPPAGRNKDLAKDICAMTVEGGLLLYGVGGSDPTRPDELLPFPLPNMAERIDQVAQTSINEPPAIRIHDIESESESGCGFLAVEIPPSPRAPHMLTIAGDNRYWGRGETGNRRLSEIEVAQLYARRERWEVDRDAQLRQVIDAMPFDFSIPISEIGPMVVSASPVMPRPGLLDSVVALEDPRDYFRRELPALGGASDPYPGQGTSGIESVHQVDSRGADCWVFTNGRNAADRYQAVVDLSRDGGFVYWHAPTIREGRGDRPYLMEQSVTRALHQAVYCAGVILERCGHAGQVDIGVALLGLESATAASHTDGWEPGPYFGASEFCSTGRFASHEFLEPKPIIRALLSRLFETISIRAYDPYAASRFPDADVSS